jgi:hypothetical protein
MPAGHRHGDDTREIGDYGNGAALLHSGYYDFIQMRKRRQS